MANQNFRVKKGLEVGLGATFLYADDTGVGINSAVPRSNLDVRGLATIDTAVIGTGIGSTALEVVGLATFRDDVYVNGNLFLTGDIGFDDFTANTGNILGVLTTVDFNSTGVSTFQDVEIKGTLTVDNGGGGGTEITDDSIETEFLNVTGITTTLDLQVGGSATITSDLDIGGVISAGVGSFTFTELTGDDLLFTGIATFQGGLDSQFLQAGIATVNDLYIDNLLYDSNGAVGAANSVLSTQGGKLVWTTAGDAGLSTVFVPGSTFYVNENGSDSNDGISPEKPWASLSYALTQVTAGANDIIELGAGEYTETFPLVVPDGITIRGASQRATLVRPTVATETNNGFQLGNASTVEDLTITGMYKPVGSNTYAFSYRPGAAITTRSPYVKAVTILGRGSVTSAADPYGYGTADNYPIDKRSAGGVFADGSVVDASSIEAGFLLNEVTIFAPANEGVTMTNGSRSELINCFVYFADKAIYGVSDLSTGFAGNGRTRLALDSPTATPNPGDTIEYYAPDGTTVLASGVVDSTDSNYVYLDGSGIGTFAVPRNRTANKVNFIDGAQISTAQAKFGSSSLDVTSSSSDAATVDSTDDFGFGTGDFTVESFIYLTALNNNKAILDFRDDSASDSAITVLESVGGAVVLTVAGSVVITSSGTLTQNAWNHLAITREAGTLRLFIDGVLEGSVANATDLGSSAPLHIGDDYNDSNGVPAYFDEFRIEKGVSKYNSAFTPPTQPLEGDSDTVLLLHFEGADGSTETTDDAIVGQDIRFNGGNTATRTSLADYSQFGADLRSMGCAVEYGNEGIVGDGSGVLLRLISINFNHVGALGDISNDYRTASKPLEVVKLNNAKIAFVSIDERGDFRVGDAFYVNQETGEISFSTTVSDLTSLSSLTISDGVNSSIITPNSGKFGNILISGNTLESITGDVNIVTAGAGDVNIFANLNVAGIVTAQSIVVEAIQRNDTAIALEDNGSDGTIRFITDGVEGFRLNANQEVGIGTDAPRADLDVIGQTRLEDLLVTGIGTIGGVTLDPGGGANDSSITVDNLVVNGIATVGFLTAAEGYVGLLTVGILTASDARITNLVIEGNLTGTGGDAIIIDGDSVITGVVTIGTNSITLDGRAGQEYIEVGTGSSNRIVGLNTFTGEQSYVQFDEGRFPERIAVGLGSTSTFAGEVSIGTTLTVDTLKYNVGLGSTLSLITLNVDNLNVGGGGGGGLDGDNLSIIGVTTLNTLNVSGIATFQENVDFEKNITVDGRANIGVASVGFATITDAAIGFATVGFATFTDAWVGSALTVKDLTIGTIQTTGGGSLVIDTLDAQDIIAIGGTFTDLEVTNDLTIGGNLKLTGDITFDEIDGRNLNITGISTLKDLEVTGFSTFVGLATFQEAFIKDLTIETIQTTGGGSLVVDAIQTENLGVTGITTTVDLNVTGFSTFANLSEFASVNVSAGATLNALRVNGASILNTVNAAFINVPNIRSIGVATFKDVNVTGVTTVVSLVAAGITAGLSTFSDLDVTNNLGVGGTVGATTFYGTFVGSLGGGSIEGLPAASIVSDVAPTLRDNGEALENGDLWYDSDGLRQYTYYIDLDSGQWVDSNPQVTIPNLGVGADVGGFVINLVEDELNINGTLDQIETVGIGSTVRIRLTDSVGVALDLNVGRDLDVTGDTNIAGFTTTNGINVTGVSSFIGVGTFYSDLEVKGDLILSGDISLDELSGTNLNITGLGTIGTLEITNDLYVSGFSTFVGDADFDSIVNLTSDSAQINLGADSDFQVSYVSSNGNIDFNDPLGNLFIDSVTSTFFKVSDTSGSVVLQKQNGENLARFIANGGVELYHNNNKNFEVTSTGVAVQGDVILTGNINSTTGIVTVGVVSTTDLEFTDAVGVALTITSLEVTTSDILVGTVGVVTTNSDAQLKSLTVTEDSTFQANLSVDGDITDVDTITATNANFANGGFSNLLTSNTLFDFNIATGIGLTLSNGIGVTAILDEDDLVSDRDDALATQQSIKKYVDDTVNGGTASVNLEINADNATATTINLETEILVLDGINNITATATNQTVTFDLTDDVTIANDLQVDNDFLVIGDTTLETVDIQQHLDATTANFVGVITAQDINSTSDRRVKENIRPIEDALDKVAQLNGIHFDFVNSGKKSMGVIAQDVEKVFPELIAGTFPKSVNYNGLIGTLIEAVKELKDQNETMRAEIEALKADK